MSERERERDSLLFYSNTVVIMNLRPGKVDC